MADWGGFLNKSNGLGGGSMRNEDFDDVDVSGNFYCPIDGAKVNCPILNPTPNMGVSKDSSGSSSSAWRIPTSPRKIPRGNSITLPSSAPVDIPDWSKIYGMNGKKVSRDGSWVAVGEGVSHKGDCGYGDHYHVNDCGDDEDGDEDDMIPPHEWIARKLARNQISSFSVCEGIGRTLKGRDLSKVRNAILTKTGFIEQLVDSPP